MALTKILLILVIEPAIYQSQQKEKIVKQVWLPKELVWLSRRPHTGLDETSVGDKVQYSV